MALGEQIQAICRKGQRTEREEERLERLKRVCGGSEGERKEENDGKGADREEGITECKNSGEEDRVLFCSL